MCQPIMPQPKPQPSEQGYWLKPEPDDGTEFGIPGFVRAKNGALKLVDKKLIKEQKG